MLHAYCHQTFRGSSFKTLVYSTPSFCPSISSNPCSLTWGRILSEGETQPLSFISFPHPHDDFLLSQQQGLWHFITWHTLPTSSKALLTLWDSCPELCLKEPAWIHTRSVGFHTDLMLDEGRRWRDCSLSTQEEATREIAAVKHPIFWQIICIQRLWQTYTPA